MAFRTNKVPVLQTKSASGAVATFNTALAMPLPSCKIAVNAWQEGSGTPSPSNPRPITGYSAINIDEVGKNWLNNPDQTTTQGSYVINNVFTPMVAGYYVLSFEFSGTNNSLSLRIDDGNGTAIFKISKTITNGHNEFLLNLPSNGSFVKLFSNAVGTYSNFQIELGNQFTTYEPYIGNTYTTIQIGSTIYGGNYDARTGVFVATHGYIEFDGSEHWINVGGSYPQAFQIDTDITNAFQGNIPAQRASNITNLYPWADDEVEQYAIRWQIGLSNGRLYVYDNNYTSDLAGFKQHLSNTHLQVVYLLNNPTTIQLPPCPIDTLEGVNNIWADTGDIDLTYKDLDIAKRGNFREVFKLPS